LSSPFAFDEIELFVGTPTMLITLGFCKRKAGLTREEFSQHWRDVHGPLLSDAPEARRYIKRYVQHHIAPSSGFSDRSWLEFDGFSEAWFESIEARQALHALPFFREKVIPDEARFIDLSQTRILMFDTQVVQIGQDLTQELFPRG
jgi:uncharacterized protein (TIGR02118 family)